MRTSLPRAITVVESATGATAALGRNHVGLRYRALFGDRIDWHPDSFEAWTADAAAVGFAAPRRPRRPAAVGPSQASSR